MNKILFLTITICFTCVLGYSQNRLQNFSLSRPLDNSLHSFSITKSDTPLFLQQREVPNSNTLTFNKSVSKMPIIKPKGLFNIPNYYNKSKAKRNLIIYTPE